MRYAFAFALLISDFIRIRVNMENANLQPFGLSQEEWSRIPKEIAEKLEKYLKEARLSTNLLSCGLDYGSGMAYSFFYGYINIVVPKTGTPEKNLEENMRDYESHHSTANTKIKFDFYKYFILIPDSMYCPSSLETEFSPSIEQAQSLTEKRKTVAGVPDRSYKNAVYKINKDNKKTYVVAEYATPVHTYYRVMDHNGEHSESYRENKQLIVQKFHSTLQRVIDAHDSCKNFCELIFYRDRDEKGRLFDVGDVLLQRIETLKSITLRNEIRRLSI